jgi:hypothetical protein
VFASVLEILLAMRLDAKSTLLMSLGLKVFLFSRANLLCHRTCLCIFPYTVLCVRALLFTIDFMMDARCLVSAGVARIHDNNAETQRSRTDERQAVVEEKCVASTVPLAGWSTLHESCQRSPSRHKRTDEVVPFCDSKTKRKF